MSKINISLELDVNKIANDLVEKECYGDGSYEYKLQEQVQREIRNYAIEQVKTEIINNVNLKEMVDKNRYSGEKYLTKLAKEIVSKELQETAEEYIKKWIDGSKEFYINRILREEFEKLLIPRVNKLLSKLVVLNEEGIEETISELHNEMSEQADIAYKAGTEQGYNDAKNLF